MRIRLFIVGCALAACGKASPASSLDLVPIPAGPFYMGCNPSVDDDHCEGSDSKPGGEVTLSTFFIQRTPVTQEDYEACMRTKVCDRPKMYHPDDAYSLITSSRLNARQCPAGLDGEQVLVAPT